MKIRSILLIAIGVIMSICVSVGFTTLTANADEPTIEYKMGDANLDGTVNTRDVVLIKQSIVGIAELTAEQKVFADTYADGVVNTRDVVLIQQYIVGMDVDLGEVHQHTYSEEWTYAEEHHWHAATCEHDVVSDKGSHNFETEITAVTCTTDGYTTYTCTTCGYLFMANIVIATGHTPNVAVEENRIEPTCTENGSYDSVVYCTICGEECSRETISLNALGHDLVHHDGQAATCTDIGWNAYETCTRCDYTTYEELKALGHNYNAVITDPTCTEQGYTTYTCSRCGDSYVADYIDALGHTASDWIITKQPTCEGVGSKHKVCIVCGIELEINNIVALGHAYGEWTLTTAPTCTAKGEETKVCSCDNSHKETRQINALGHKPAAAVEENRIDATCTENGSYDIVVYCSVCGEECSRETISLNVLGHDLVHHDGKATTCTEKGWNAYETCSRCDYTTYEELATLGHTAGYPTEEYREEPTCTDNGSYDSVVYCSVCGVELSREGKVISALGHSYNSVITEATCTEQGYTTYTCTRCGDSYVSDYVDSLGHDLIHHNGKAATCTEKGWNAYETCTRCDYTTYEEIPALGHTPDGGIEENRIEPTCTEKGSYDIVGYCYVCREELWRQSAEIPALGHNLVHHDGKAATCTKVGWNTYETCTRCDYTTYEEIPALGHKPAAAVEENRIDATCTENGSYDSVVYCSVCGVELSREGEIVNALGHNFVKGKCRVCGVEEYTEGLRYSLLPEENSYLVSDIGTAVGTKIIIPKNYQEKPVVGIKESAFSGCDSITEVIIPDGVTSIGNYAFDGCVCLNTIEIPTSITSIGNYAFFGCNDLTNLCYVGIVEEFDAITIGEANDCLLNANVYYDGYFNFRLLEDDTYEIKPKDNLPSDIVLPFTYNGKKITSIGGYAFYGNEKLHSVVIPTGITNIKSGAFYDCINLTDIIIGDSVTHIGLEAFRNCYNLTSITIPDSVTSIGKQAFYNCSSLIGVIFDENIQLTIIEHRMFYNCSSLTSINIPDSVTSIEQEAFYACKGLVSINIPINVTSISWGAFQGCRNVNYITIPKSVGTIGSYAFSGCESLTKVNYTGTVDDWCRIGFTEQTSNPLFYTENLYINNELVTEVNITSGVAPYAFYNCSNLTSVTIGNNAKNIGQYAFSGCSKLTSITIPDSVTSIGFGAFSGCSGLTTVHWNAINCTSAGSFDGPVFNSCANIVDINIGEKVTTIPGNVFKGLSSLTSIEIPDSVTSIGANAFYNCSNLLYLTIGRGVSSIGSRAFTNCDRLIEIYNKSTVNIYARNVYTDEIGESRLSTDENGFIIYTDGEDKILVGYCGTATELILPAGITEIGDRAFSGCSSLTSIIIPDSVTSIGEYAFSGCYKLVDVLNKSNLSITVGSTDYGYVGYYAKNVYKQSPEEKTYIDSDGYTIYVDGENKILLNYVGTTTELILLDDITEINQYAFRDCTNLTSINIPDSVTSIGNYAFDGCSSLTNVSFGENSLLTSIGADSFWGCTSLKDLIIPNSVTNIGEYAFYYCSSLTSITIPDSVTSIGDSAFNNCSSLTSITIGNSVTSIGEFAFKGCSGLTSITIPDGVTSIGQQAFYNCSSLTSITIPDSVTGIGDYAFYNCSSLTSITIGNSVTSIGRNAFSGCINLTSIVVDGNNKNYSYTDGILYNKEKTEILFVLLTCGPTINLPDTLTSIRDYAFYHCSSLTSITIPDSVTIIGDYAFSEAGLNSIIIGRGVQTIGKYAFDNCSSLSNIIFKSNGNLESIGNYAFRKCSGLTSLIIPDYVVSIGEYAFVNCKGLLNVVIGDNVKSIGKNSFGGCSSLTSITIGNSVTSIGNNAFSNCKKLIEIYNKSDYSFTLGNSVIGGGIAYYAKNIYTPTSGSSKLTTDSDGFIVYSDEEEVILVGYVGNETDIIIPDGITTIWQYAFYNYSRLISIVIPDSVTSIGDGAFNGCYSLESISVPFVGATKDGTVNKKFGYIFGTESYFASYNISKFMLPVALKKVTVTGGEIYDSSFASCYEIRDFVIGEGVENVEAGAFDDCYQINSVTLLSDCITINLSEVFNRFNILIIGNNVNLSGGQLAYTNVTNIYVFDDNELYKTIDGNLYSKDGKTLIQYAVGENDTSFNVPDSVMSIEHHAFENSSSLTSIVIPDSVTSIGSAAFYWCSSLTSITIPDSVISIGSYAFSYCSSLKSITFDGTIEQWNGISKGSGWKNNVPASVVHCSDGDISI